MTRANTITSAYRAAQAMREAARGAQLPPMPHGLRAWLTRAMGRRGSAAERLQLRLEVAPLLDMLPAPQRAEVERRLAYVLGDTPEPRRYLQPGEVAVRAEQLQAWADAAEAAAVEATGSGRVLEVMRRGVVRWRAVELGADGQVVVTDARG